MRAIATLVVLLFGVSLALASEHLGGYGPIKPEPKAKAAQSKSKPAAKRAAKPAPRRAAKPAPSKPTLAKPALPKPKPEQGETAKSDAAKQQPAQGKTGKSDPNPTGAVASATKPSGPAETYAELSHAARVALQTDLSWAGVYIGPLDGAFGEQLAEAVKAYQKRNKIKVTGLLTPAEREALAEAVRPRQAEYGWRLVEDPVTGARVGLPERLATDWARAPSGTRWSSEQGQLQIETFRIDTGATLDALFEQHRKETSRRRVVFSAMRDDYFVVSGIQGLRKFHTRVYARNGEVRGLSILYDQAMAGTIDPMIVPMASAFQPFARYTVASIAEQARRKVEYGTALALSRDGHFVAARAIVAGCQVIAIAGLGNADLVAEDRDGDLALLRVYGARNVAPIGLSDLALPAPGSEVRIVGVADPETQDGGDAVSAVAARLGGGAQARALEPAPAQGFAGAAAVDAQGGLLGVVVPRPAVVAGPPRPAQPAVVPAERVRLLLAAGEVTPAPAHSGADAVAAAARRVICVRR